MRSLLTSVSLTRLSASPLLAQEAGAEGRSSVAEPGRDVLDARSSSSCCSFVLSRFAFKPLTAAVEAREKALEAAIDAAKRIATRPAQLLAEQQQGGRCSARGRAAGIAESSRRRATSFGTRCSSRRSSSSTSCSSARAREIDNERKRAIADLRREAVDLALAGASKVIERNLDDQTNRKLVESFLATVPTGGNGRGQR